jgi:hypothetical protein
MTVAILDYVDAIAIGDDGKTLILLITDHFDWDDQEFEFDHLMMLQDKINLYGKLIEGKQYEEVYPDAEFERFVVDIRFLYDMSDNCLKYIDVINRQLSVWNIEAVPKFTPKSYS